MDQQNKLETWAIDIRFSCAAVPSSFYLPHEAIYQPF